MKNTATEVI